MQKIELKVTVGTWQSSHLSVHLSRIVNIMPFHSVFWSFENKNQQRLNNTSISYIGLQNSTFF